MSKTLQLWIKLAVQSDSILKNTLYQSLNDEDDDENIDNKEVQLFIEIL